MSTSNRAARVTDRVRERALGAGEGSEAPGRAAFTQRQLDFLTTRLSLLRSAMLALNCAMGAFVATSLLIGLSKIDWMDGWGAVGIGPAGAAVLFVACVQLVREARLGTRSTLEEIEHLRGPRAT